ncbi:MAG: MarC family protein, partial [Candidatus Micrarchaeota archaeon]
MNQLLQDIVNAAIVFLVIMDPFSTLPVFMSITQRFSAEQKAMAANEAAVVALIPIIAFAAFGAAILSFMGISMSSFKVAGGMVLGILGLQLVLGTSKEEKSAGDYKSAAVIVAVPLITGPAVITSTVLF